LFLAAFVDGFLRAIGIIPPFLDIDINLMNQVIDKVKDEVEDAMGSVKREL